MRNMKGRIKAYRASGRMFAQTVSTAAEHAAADMIERNHSAYCAGVLAFDNGLAFEASPYKRGTEGASAWAKGYTRAWAIAGCPAQEQK
jgi:hypothetical protein